MPATPLSGLWSARMQDGDARQDGFSARGDILWEDRIRAGFTAKESRREEWPLQSVFTLHVTDLQQRLPSHTGVDGLQRYNTPPRPYSLLPLSRLRHDTNDTNDDHNDDGHEGGRPLPRLS